jgi:hypothetical protein
MNPRHHGTKNSVQLHAEFDFKERQDLTQKKLYKKVTFFFLQVRSCPGCKMDVGHHYIKRHFCQAARTESIFLRGGISPLQEHTQQTHCIDAPQSELARRIS